MSTAVERALADLRAIRVRAVATPVEEPEKNPGCRCAGDRPGYQWHQRNGELPACEASIAANRAYLNQYRRATGRTTRAGRRKRSTT